MKTHDLFPDSLELRASQILDETSPARARRLARLLVSDMYEDESTNPNMNAAPDTFIRETPEPQPSRLFDAFQDYDRLIERTSDPSEVMMFGAIYSGVRLEDDSALEWARLGKEFMPTDSFHYITGRFHPAAKLDQARRLSLRVIPGHWQDPTLQTPFSVRGEGNNLQLLHSGKDGETLIGDFDALLPPDTARTVAYLRENRREGDNGVVVNPIMTCPHRCQFCSRQYDILNRGVDKEGKIPTILFSPTEISRYVNFKYPDICWKDISRVSVVTGSFTTFDEMYSYLEKLRGALFDVSGGDFLSHPDTEQEILVLTHLARTEDDFKKLQELGVSVQDTVEILDDQRRKEFMEVAHKEAIPKYAFEQADIIRSMKQAIRILGTKNYRATLILGLDDYKTTEDGFKAMQDSGLKRLYTPTFQPYGTIDHALYQMSFTELVEARQMAHAMFDKVY